MVFGKQVLIIGMQIMLIIKAKIPSNPASKVPGILYSLSIISSDIINNPKNIIDNKLKNIPKMLLASGICSLLFRAAKANIIAPRNMTPIANL